MSRDRLPLNCPYADLIVRRTAEEKVGIRSYSSVECPGRGCGMDGVLIKGDPTLRASNNESKIVSMKNTQDIANALLPEVCAVNLGQIVPVSSKSITLNVLK